MKFSLGIVSKSTKFANSPCITSNFEKGCERGIRRLFFDVV
jgi:hypothetical protein